ncbi:hypothetical protein [Nodularia sp. UHCC 0506]|uniref:hypothetical protein n=1 Tax=Nodularia sp. UHCC 0506 TaxID=3110243 RepID=UPI002B1FB930|nr:hypothetical protein [Nodularia sp. UHCC 0506]MEA5515712.1 hypothetical protein [Nodularia sp. UHCC 0506]
MLQAARTHLLIPEPSEDLITNEPWSIDFYADGLMDELFADIDEILDVSGNLPSHTLRHGSRTPRPIEDTSARNHLNNSGEFSTPVTSKYEHLQTINVPQIVLQNSLTRTDKTVSQVRNEQVGTVVVNQPGAISKHQKTQMNLRKLLIAGTTIGVAIAGTIYMVQSGLLSLITSRLTEPDIYLPQAQTQLSPQVDAQAELVDYMLGALAIIEQQKVTSDRTSDVSRLNNPGVSDVAVNNTQQPIANRSTGVVERIYIPVYQAPSPMRYAPPPTPGAIASQTDAVNTQMKPVQSSAKPANANITAAIRPEINPVPMQNASMRPSNIPGVTIPQRPSVPTDTQQQASAVTTATHTLAGLLELGEKSAALFEFEGVTRRIHMGETIGATGWTLVDVSNGKAIVRRNGEVRSIFAGQKL